MQPYRNSIKLDINRASPIKATVPGSIGNFVHHMPVCSVLDILLSVERE